MKHRIKKLTALLCCIPAVTLATTQPPQQIKVNQLRLQLQYLTPLFVQANVLPTDLLDVVKKIGANQSIPSLQLPISQFANEDLAKATIYHDFQDIKSIPIKDGVFYPQDVEQVKTLVSFASTHHLQIRTMGARHSPPVAIYDPLSLHQILINLDGNLRKIQSFVIDPSHEFAIVKVGAGCNLGVNTADPRSTLENSFNYQVDQAGFALPTLGGISHQTIAGFLQTSSSGGTAQHTIADAVEAIEWVNGKGELRSAKRGDPEFDAVVVSMGLFGIITDVTFKLPKKYLVEGTEVNRELQDSYLAQDANGHFTALHNALFKDNEYIHINWLPQKYVDRTMQWVGKAVPINAGPIVPYKHALGTEAVSNLAVIAFRIGNWIDEYGHSDALLKMKAEILKIFSNPNDAPQEFRDVWYKALPIDDQADVDGKIKTLFSELWFPEDKLDEVMQKLQELFKNDPKAAGNFIVELYCAKQSPYWLSPAYGHNAFRVDLYWWDRNIGDPKQYFGRFWQTLLTIPGARLHWGKFLPIPGEKYGDVTFTSELYQKGYPKFAEWSALREQNDPQQLFVTDYWRKIFAIPKP